MKGTLESRGEGPLAHRESWSIEGPRDARKFAASGRTDAERSVEWRMAEATGPAGEVASFDLQLAPAGRPSEVTTMAFRCFGGRAYGTTIGPGGVPEKTETSFPQGSAFRGYSVALDGITAAGLPLRVGHGRRLLVIEVDADDLIPHVQDWMLLAVAKRRVDSQAGPASAVEYEFRRADAPGRAHTIVVAGPEGHVYRATRTDRGGKLDVVPRPAAP